MVNPVKIIERSDQGWRERAACSGTRPELWDSSPGLAQPSSQWRQIMVCESCPVVEKCASDALDAKDEGVIRAGINIPQQQFRSPYVRKALGWIAGGGDIRAAREFFPKPDQNPS